MRTKQFCCDATKDQYMAYYADQSQTGSGMPIFHGSRSQRGHGLGSVLGGLFRSALPMLKSGAQALGKQVLQTGMNIANDVVEGHGFEESFKNRVLPQGLKQVGRDALRTGMNVAQGMLRDRFQPTHSSVSNESNPWRNASNSWEEASNQWSNAPNPWSNANSMDPWNCSGNNRDVRFSNTNPFTRQSVDEYGYSNGLNGNPFESFPPPPPPRRNINVNNIKGNPWANFNQSGSGRRRRQISQDKKAKKVKKDIFT